MSRNTTEKLRRIEEPADLARAIVGRIRDREGRRGRDPDFTRAVLRLARFSETDDALRGRLQEALPRVLESVERAPGIVGEWPVGALLAALRVDWDDASRRQIAANRVLGLLQQQVLRASESPWRLAACRDQAPDQPSAGFAVIALANEVGVLDEAIVRACERVLTDVPEAPVDEATAREQGALLALLRSIASKSGGSFDRSIDQIAAWPPGRRDAAWSTFPASVRGLTGSTVDIARELLYGSAASSATSPDAEQKRWRRKAALALPDCPRELTAPPPPPARVPRPKKLRVTA